MVLNFTLGPPDPSVLHFQKCVPVVHPWSLYHPQVLADYYNDTHALESFEGKSPVHSLFAALQTYLDANNQLARPTTTEVWQWLKQPEVRSVVTVYATGHCASELCPHLDWEGREDVAGLGVCCVIPESSGRTYNVRRASGINHAIPSRAPRDPIQKAAAEAEAVDFSNRFCHRALDDHISRRTPPL